MFKLAPEKDKNTTTKKQLCFEDKNKTEVTY